MTSTQQLQQQLWLKQYSIQDLTRTLVRQYLYQHNMFKTLNTFENQDKKNQKKINRLILIKILSLNNLVIKNKTLQKEQQCKSLLMILVKYLKQKFQNRVKFNQMKRKDNEGSENYNQRYSTMMNSQDKMTEISRNNNNKDKQFSMNGDNQIRGFDNQFIMGKNTQRSSVKDKYQAQTLTNNSKVDQKTSSQDGFYKKTSIKKSNEKSSEQFSINHDVRENKNNLIKNRPGTANPSLNNNNKNKPHQNIYNKLKTNPVNQQINKKEKVGNSAINKAIGNNKGSIQDKKINNLIETQQRNKNLKIDNKNKFQQVKKIQQVSKNNQSKKQTKIQITDINKPQVQVKKLSQIKQESKISPLKISQKEQKQNYDQYQDFQEFQEEKKQTYVEEKSLNKLVKENIQIKIQSPKKQQIQSPQKQKINIVKQKIDSKNHSPKKQQTKVQQKYNIITQKPKIAEIQIFSEKPQQDKQKTLLNNIIDNKKQTISDKIFKQQISHQKQKIKNENKNNQSLKPTSSSGTRVMRKLLKKPQKQQTSYQFRIQQKKNNQMEEIKMSKNIEEKQKKQVNQNQMKLQSNQTFKNKDNQLIKPVQLKKQQPQKQVIKSQNLMSLNNPSLTSTSSKNMMVLKKKPKNSQPQQQQYKYPSKFKFDQNFVDQPLNAKKQNYPYQMLKFNKMTIEPQLKPKNADNFILECKIDYTKKPTLSLKSSVGSTKKLNQKILNPQKAEQLKTIMFQKGNCHLPKAWHQGLILSPHKDTPYGIKQLQGGPCGIIAAFQCYFLKHLLYLSKPVQQDDIKNQTRRQICLIAALCDVLWKVKSNDKIILIIPSNKNFTGAKLDFSNLLQVQIQAKTFQSVYQAMWTYKSSFIGQTNHGVTVLVYSIVMTKGIQNIYNEIDIKQNPLIGQHGHCTQQLVNLFITGQAASNCFDGKKQLQQGFTLHGISNKSQYGFLTVYQTLQYIQVGKNLKNPLFPIWIISKQFHYHVIFGNHYLLSQNNDCQKFDLVYFDGLYACQNYIRLTFDKVEKDEFGMVKQITKMKDLPLIEQVLLKKWGERKVDWNGSTKIL